MNFLDYLRMILLNSTVEASFTILSLGKNIFCYSSEADTVQLGPPVNIPKALQDNLVILQPFYSLGSFRIRQ